MIAARQTTIFDFLPQPREWLRRREIKQGSQDRFKSAHGIEIVLDAMMVSWLEIGQKPYSIRCKSPAEARETFDDWCDSASRGGEQ